MLLQTLCYAQKNQPIEGGTILKLKDGARFVGTYEGQDEMGRLVKISNGDIITIRPSLIRREYHPDQISLYKKRKFHYKTGGAFNYSIGVADEHFNMDLSYSRHFTPRLELGLGIGFHRNSFWFTTSSDFHFVDVNSFPMYAQAKFDLTQGLRRIYVKGKAGYANNIMDWGMTSIKDGITLDGAIGVSFPSKGRFKHYVELSQYTSYAQGSHRNFSSNAVSDIDFNVWFNRVVMTWGFEFGK